MADWYEVFDYEEVLYATRQRVGRALTGFAAVAAGVVVAVPLVAPRLPNGEWLAVVAAVLLLVAGLRLVRRMIALRSVVWCVKLSVHRVVGYDYGRRTLAFSWRQVERVELDGEGLRVIGTDEQGARRALRVPRLFPQFATLSHRAVDYAEAFDCPIYVDGQPWQLLDVHAVYPFLRDDLAREA